MRRLLLRGHSLTRSSKSVFSRRRNRGTARIIEGFPASRYQSQAIRESRYRSRPLGKKVIYLKIKKSKDLMRVYIRSNDFLGRVFGELFGSHRPSSRVPHTALAMNNLAYGTFSHAWKAFEKAETFLEQAIQSICLVNQDSSRESLSGREMRANTAS